MILSVGEQCWQPYVKIEGAARSAYSELGLVAKALQMLCAFLASPTDMGLAQSTSHI